MIRLTKAGFRRWLEANLGAIVGVTEAPDNCPFCRYLKSCGAKRAAIQVSYRVVDGKRHKHSKWQRDFQHQAMYMERELDVIGLRGREALGVLDGLA